MRLSRKTRDTSDANRPDGAGRGKRRTSQLNPRQRQGMLLVVLALIGLIAVFALMASYVSSVNQRVGPVESEVVLKSDVKPFTRITSADLSYRDEPTKWAAPDVLTSPGPATGSVSPIELKAGTVLQQDMLEAPPSAPHGDQTFSISLDSIDAVDGQVRAGSNVNLIGVFGTHGGESRVIVPNVKVLDVGSGSGSIPLLLALTPQQVLTVEGAKSWASDLSVSLITPGTHQATPPPVSQGSL